MTRRLPPDAFDFYASLGPRRSYSLVADHYGVSKRAITKCARREGWQQRLAQIEERVRERSDSMVVDALEEMNSRHLRTAKVLQAKALEALRALPITTAMQAVRALEVALKNERLVLGEPTDRTATQVEEVIRNEYERWMTGGPDADALGDDVLDDGEEDELDGGSPG